MTEFPIHKQKTIDRGELHHKEPKYLLIGSKQWLYLQNKHELTIRECEIARLACQGLRNNEIAKNLKITHGTVKTHIRNIYRKVRVKNKIAMLLKFVADSRELSTYPLSIVPVKEISKSEKQTPSCLETYKQQTS